MESQNFYLGLVILASLLFIVWFFVGRKGGYGQPTPLKLKKGSGPSTSFSSNSKAVLQAEPLAQEKSEAPSMRDVTPQAEALSHPPPPPSPPQPCFFVYNGHDWDAFEVLGASPYASFSEVTKIYQQQIKKADPGKHEFLQSAYMAILKRF